MWKFSEAVKREPRIDFLVFNAGIMAVNDLQHTPAGFEAVLLSRRAEAAFS